MKFFRILTAAIVAGALAGGVTVINADQAEAVRVLPTPVHKAPKVKPRGPMPELGNSVCWPLGSRWACLVWRYACPGEPFPPLSSGVIPACKKPGVYPVKTYRLFII